MFACWATTIVVTWPLWRARATPPMLPFAYVPALSFGPILLASLVVAAFRPRAGLAAHLVLVGLAIAADQTRLQPWAWSFPLLLIVLRPTSACRRVARAHLCALWFWAGLHKLLSPAFASGIAPWLVSEIVPFVPPTWASSIAFGVAAFEIAVALLCAIPRTRRVGGVCAIALHVGIVVVLSRLGAVERNIAIWPWNVALATCAWWVFVRPADRRSLDTGQIERPAFGPRARAAFNRARLAANVAALVLVVAPVGWYLGLVDAAWSHHLYSGAVPTAVWCDAIGRCSPLRETREVVRTLGVPLPPEPRLLQRYFHATCRPGDILRIHDARRWIQGSVGPRLVTRCRRG